MDRDVKVMVTTSSGFEVEVRRGGDNGDVWVKPALDGDGELQITPDELAELSRYAAFVLAESAS